MTNPYDRPAPVYVGFADGGLCEFTTTSGQYVYLHEMECVDMQHRPLTRQFVLTFECVASDLVPESVAVLTFDDAEIYQWETDYEVPAWTVREPRVRGQVNDLACLPDGPDSELQGVSFHLSLFDVTVSFFASKVTCDVREGRWRPSVDAVEG